MATLRDLREQEVDIVTIGQYLQPSNRQLKVERYVTPVEFIEFKSAAEKLGFRHVESGPLVRSSYHAWSHVALGVRAFDDHLATSVSAAKNAA